MIKAMEKVLFAVDELTGQRPENESNRYCLYYIIKASVESKVEAIDHKIVSMTRGGKMAMGYHYKTEE